MNLLLHGKFLLRGILFKYPKELIDFFFLEDDNGIQGEIQFQPFLRKI